MISIDDICRELDRIDETAKTRADRLGYCGSEINGVLSDVQQKFGGDPAAQSLAAMLLSAMDRLARADSDLYSLRSDIKSCISNLR